MRAKNALKFDNNRHIDERWFITGELELVTPTSLSNGDPDPFIDLPIVVDELEGYALLTGASLAGALRNYIHEFDSDLATTLFGGAREDKEGAQSPLIVDDALSRRLPDIELRDGVSIDPATRTAKEGEKYDRQLLAAGTRFDLRFELLLSSHMTAETRAMALRALAQALHGLEIGDIRLGGRKRRGYGQCRVNHWQVWRYDLMSREGLHAWLTHGRRGNWQARAEKVESILHLTALGEVALLEDKRDRFEMQADLLIDGSVLVRSGFEEDYGPDVSHLKSRRKNKHEPILPGTSLAGVLRAQALRIARTVAGSDHRETADKFVNEMFGFMPKPDKKALAQRNRNQEKKQASRVIVDEVPITGNYHELVQSRVKIDRFTGGAYESALFAEQPVFGGQFRLRVTLMKPEAAEIGLLLLLLKDLWTGFVPIGGGANVGRGRLKGTWAKLRHGSAAWEITAQSEAEVFVRSIEGSGQTRSLNKYVEQFQAKWEAKDGNGQ